MMSESTKMVYYWHLTKQMYSPKYQIFITACIMYHILVKTFLATYVFLDIIEAPLTDGALHAHTWYDTEYQILVKNATLDSAGTSRTLSMIR